MATIPDESNQKEDVLQEIMPEETVAAVEDAESQIRQISRRSFLWGALTVGAGIGGLGWLNTRRKDEGIPWPLRRVLEVNEQVSRDLSSSSRLAPTFPASRIDPLRENGTLGLEGDFNQSEWAMQIEGLAAGDGAAQVGLREIKSLPRVDIITELRCIEGWATVVQWSGARLSDFMAKYPPAIGSGAEPGLGEREDFPAYIGLKTPDNAYYVGIEMEAALHPQTLLCYAMNGRPLTIEHGAPLRLAIPTKYGIKSLKRIGTFTYTNRRPADYWSEQGYDYFAGH